MRYFLILLTLLWAAPIAAETPCGPDAACEIDNGDYHLVFPPDWDGKSELPALIWYHGHNSQAASIFRSRGLIETFANNGYLLIAPNGAPLPGRKTRAWPARLDGSDRRDDIAFTLSVLDDVEARLPIDTARIHVAGFSAGGSMAWLMACHAAERFAGFASVSGAMRRPVPAENCQSGPFNLIQIHGFTDKQVPFEGRGIRDWHQGDLFESFGLARATNACRSNPDNIAIEGEFRCRDWNNSCETGGLRMCIHDGGHGLPKGWTDQARAFFEQE